MKDNFDDKDTLNENEQAETSAAADDKNSIGADIIRGHINTIILRALYERDKYGYEIMNDIEQKSHNQYSLKQPTLYSALKRLENQGYIIAYWKTDEVSFGGRRKYFTLTDSGREITEKNLAEWEYSRTIIDSLISDRSFDFSQPAPTPVDFTIMRNSVSRVPIKRNANDDDDEDEDEDESITESKSDTDEKPSQTDTNTTVYQTVVNESEQFVEQTTTYEDNALLYQMLAQQSNTPKQGEQPAEEEKQLSEEEFAERIKQHENYLRLISETPIKDAPENTEVVTEETIIEEQSAQPQQRLYTEEEVSEIISQYDGYQPAPPPQPVAPVQPEQKLYTEEEVEARIRQHENYMRLISEPTKEKPDDIVPNSENINTNKLLYNVKPKTERDYKNLINGIYDRAISNGTVETNYVHKEATSRQNNAAIKRKPATSTNPIIDRGLADGVRISPSYEYDSRTNYATKTTFNKGFTLLMCSGIVLFILLIEFIFCMIFKDNLHVSVAYPIVILVIGLAQFAVFGTLYLKGYGTNSTKPMTNAYLTRSIIFSILLVLIICVSSFLFNINFTIASDVMKLIVIPSITVLNIVVFTVSYKLLIK